MDVTITRYLREDRGGKDLAAIHFRVCWQGQKVRFSAREKIHADLWDEANQLIKKSPDKTIDRENKSVSRRLGIYTTQLEKFFELRSVAPSVAEVQAEIERIRRDELGQAVKVKQEPEPVPEGPKFPTLREYLDEYAKTLPGGLSKSTRQHIEAIGIHLDAFMGQINWQHLRINTLNQLKNYLSEEMNLSDNTVAAYFGSFKGALKYARVLEYPVPDDYTLVSGSPADVIRPALTKSHLEKLANLDFEENEQHLERTNWLFRLACYTGLRRSDLHQVRMANVREVEGHPCLLAIQQKTANSVAIPLIGPAMSLIEQRPDGLPLTTGHWYNRNIQAVAKKAEFTETAVVASRYKGKIISSTLPLHDAITSHTARRTFAVIMTEGGLNTRVLQELMGHVTIVSTQKYTKLSNPTIVAQTVDAWKKIW